MLLISLILSNRSISKTRSSG